MASPIQIVLNPENYEEAREAGGGGGRKDFFAHRDAEFSAHRTALMSQIDTISGVLSAQSQGDVGFVKVILRREAWAKSHRPVACLFRNDRTPVVGGGDLGVMIIEARPGTLRQVAAEIAKAETRTEMRFNEKKQRDEPHPSARKSETGAIDRIELYGPTDRRTFSVEDAVAWLSNPMTGSSYQVELFDSPPPRSEWDRLDAGHRRLVESFIAGFNGLDHGLAVERLPSRHQKQAILSVRLDESSDQPVPPLQSKALAPIARHMAGFGMPPSADRILETGDHSITLVFASRIRRDQQINFRFAWPASLVGPGGKCRGRAKITLVSTPPLDARFGSEFVRVNINATLQQEQATGGWKGQLEPLYLPSKREAPAIEAERIEHDLKWSPVKVLAKTFPQGVSGRHRIGDCSSTI